MRPFQVVKTFVVDVTGQPICYCLEEATAQRIAYALNELERHSADALPPESKLFLRPERLRGATLEWPDDVSLLDDENAGERSLEENAAGIREYNARVEQALSHIRQAEDERLASLKEPGAADALRAAIHSPTRLHGKVKREVPPESTPSTRVYELASQLLGGKSLLRTVVHGASDAHNLISHGLPTQAMTRLVEDLHLITLTDLLMVVGISEQDFQRRKEQAAKDPQSTLKMDEGSRLWKFSEILAQASATLGTQEAAEEWLNRPQTALDGKRPMELLTTALGAKLVEDFLLRMEFGVYT